MTISIVDNSTIELPSVVTIAEAESLHACIEEALQHKDVVKVDSSAVSRIDTAALQQLLLFQQQLKSAGQSILWISPSEVLLDAAKLLGLFDHLALTNTSSSS